MAVIAAVEIPDAPRSLRDAGLVLGGLLIGLISLIIDEKLRGGPEREANKAQQEELNARHLREDRRYQAAVDDAFYLGLAASLLPVRPEEDLWKVLQQCIESLDLQFAPEESKLITTEPANFEEARAVTALAVSKGRNLGPQLRCFLRLGNTVAWLQGVLETWRRTGPVLGALEEISENPFLRDEQRYASIVSDLIQALSPGKQQIAPEDRARLNARVVEILGEVPAFTLEERDLKMPGQTSEWIWVTAGDEIFPIRFLGPYTISQRRNYYEVSTDGGPPVKVTRDAAGWHCKAHPNATEADPCQEIDVTLDATEGGQPVTEARLIPVRLEPVDSPDDPPAPAEDSLIAEEEQGDQGPAPVD